MRELFKASLITIFGLFFIFICTIAIFKPVIWLWIIGSIMLVVNGVLLWRLFKSYGNEEEKYK